MNKQKLKNILKNYFKDSTIDALLRGSRLPSMKKAITLKLKENIPLSAWIDIKSYMEEDPKTGEKPLNKAS